MKPEPSRMELNAIKERGMFLTVTDITELLKVSRPVVDRLIHTGQLPAAKFGGKQYRVKTDDFIKWWDNRVKQEQRDILKGCLTKQELN